MTEIMLAYCGLVCTRCEGYLATQAGDEAWKERLAKKAREEFGNPDATAASVACDGCKSSGQLCGYCAVCGIRACAVERGVENCGACSEFSTCEQIQKFLEMVPEARASFAG